jgi:hypothetical protein
MGARIISNVFAIESSTYKGVCCTAMRFRYMFGVPTHHVRGSHFLVVGVLVCLIVGYNGCHGNASIVRAIACEVTVHRVCAIDGISDRTRERESERARVISTERTSERMREKAIARDRETSEQRARTNVKHRQRG